VLGASASASSKPAAHVSTHHPRASLNRFDLNGYVINAEYPLGRNTGNTPQQTYKHPTVQDVPIAQPESAGTITVVKCGKDPVP
jgi:hypothetical protein